MQEKGNDNTAENLKVEKLIEKQATKQLELQFDSIKNNQGKSNWVIITNIAIIAAILNYKPNEEFIFIIVIILNLTSILFLLFTFNTTEIKYGTTIKALIKESVNNKSELEIIKKLNVKNKENIEFNKKSIDKNNKNINRAIIISKLGIILLLFVYINKIIFKLIPCIT